MKAKIIIILILIAFSIGCIATERKVEPILTTTTHPTITITSSPTVTDITGINEVSFTVTSTGGIRSTPTTIPTQETFVERSYTAPDSSDPFVDSFGYKRLSQRKYPYTISNCWFKQYFPEVVNDINYGVNGNPPKLISISAFEFRKFEREFFEGKGQGSTTIGFSCQDPPGTDVWDFIEVSAQITPRNAKPSIYEVMVIVKKYGRTIAQIKSNETFTQDQQISFYTYIPIRQKEVDSISGCELQFKRLTNL